MRIGKITVAGPDEIAKIYGAAFGVLETVGMQVFHPVVLDRLEAYGAEISRADRRARMPAAVVERAIAAMRKAANPQPRREGRFTDPFSVSLGDGCLFYWDFQGRTRRKATREDFLDTVRFADAVPEVASFSAPVEIGGIPIPMMVLEMQALCYLNSAKPSGVENNIPAQAKHLAALKKVVQDHRGDPGWVGNAQGVTSPLIFGDRAAELYLEGGKYGFGGGVYTMAIAGINAPATIEGCAVQATAELLGAWTCLMATDENRKIGTLVLTGTADMRTGKPCWSSPGAVRQNSLVSAVFDEMVGIPISLSWSWYTDAVEPGFQCCLDRLMRLLAQAPQIGAIEFHLGDLDGASLFSLEQASLDLDVCRSAWELFRPASFDGDAMGLEEIRRISADHGRSTLGSDFTWEHFRDSLWMPKLIRHDFWTSERSRVAEAAVLEEAHRRWKRIVAEHEPYRPPAAMARDIEKVLARAREELL